MATGRDFEVRVKGLLERELNRRNLGLDPQMARVHLHPSYPSQARGNSIVIDVALELYRRGADQPYFIWVWECKDYARRVPVDDVEEFHAKLEQIRVHKVKGTIASTHGFQEGAVRLAESWGIGLARILPDGSIITLVEMAALPTRRSVLYGLIEEDAEKLTTLFYGLATNGQPTTDVAQLVSWELKPE